MRQLFRRLITFLLYVACVAMFGIFSITLADVGLRAIRGSGVRGGNEIVEMMLPAAAFLAVAYTQLSNGHVASTLVTDRMRPRAAAVLRGAGMMCAVAFLAYFTLQMTVTAYDAYLIDEVRYGFIKVLAWPTRFAIAFGFVILTIQACLDVVDEFVTARRWQSDGRPQALQSEVSEESVNSI